MNNCNQENICIGGSGGGHQGQKCLRNNRLAHPPWELAPPPGVLDPPLLCSILRSLGRHHHLFLPFEFHKGRRKTKIARQFNYIKMITLYLKRNSVTSLTYKNRLKSFQHLQTLIKFLTTYIYILNCKDQLLTTNKKLQFHIYLIKDLFCD